MSEFILPVGFIHATLAIKHATVQRRALVTFAGDVTAPPFTQTNAETLHADIVAALQPRYDSEVTFPSLVVLVGNDGPAGRLESTSTSSGGGGASAETPPQVAFIAQKNSGFSGRAFRGRNYYPWPNEAEITPSGAISTTNQASWQVSLTGILTAFQAAGGNNLTDMVILHSQIGVNPTPVVSYRISAVVGTQRRRLDRGITT